MLYLLFSLSALLAGVIITRRPRAALLEGVRLLWLIIPAVFLAAAPSFLAYTNPDMLWADDNRLLKLLISAAHATLLLITLTNLASAIITTVSSWRSLVKNYIASRLIDRQKFALIKQTDLRRQLLLAVVSVFLILSISALTAGLTAHMAVLTQNNGLMPITEEYLNDIDDPIIAEGVRNNALYFKRLITDDTVYPELGQIIRADKLSFMLPEGFVYISLPELIIAFSLFGSVLFSIFTDTLRRGRKLEDKSKDSEDLI